jgi:hypothetical protein
MTAMDESLKPPPGWRFAAFPWFAMDEPAELPRLLRVGSVLLPEFFHLVIAPEAAWRTLRDGAQEPSAGAGPVLFLNFQVFEGQLEMTEARTAYEDIGVALEKVRKVAKPAKWKLLGIQYMTQYLVQFMDEGGRPESDHMRNSPDWPVAGAEDHDPYGNRPKAALEWLDQLQEHAAEAYATARGTPSPQRKRVRITDEFLRKVARVYAMAERIGLPPTREVANQFKAPHSTAAKWVGSARRKKLLPPVGVPVDGAFYAKLDRLDQIEEALADDGLQAGARRRLEVEQEEVKAEIANVER